MAVRVLVVASVVNIAMVGPLAAPMAGMAIVGLGASWIFWKRSTEKTAAAEPTAEGVRVQNPFELSSALKFGAVLTAVLFASKAAVSTFGTTGLYVTTLLTGSADVDATTLSAAELAKGKISSLTAVTAILLAVVSNTVVKAILAIVLGGWGFARRIVLMYAVALLTAALCLLALWLGDL
jgi:uncharacterized membrane protein (DUF4010 family)